MDKHSLKKGLQELREQAQIVKKQYGGGITAT